MPEGFYDPLSKQVKAMSILQKSVRVNDGEIIGTSLIYSRVIALQLTNVAMTVENVFKHELAPIPTSIFNDDGDLRPAKSKADMKRTLESKASTRTMNKPERTIIDVSATLWLANWPTKASVIDYLQIFTSYISQKLATGNINLVFDRYYDYSRKSCTRSDSGRSTCWTHKLTPTFPPLPSKITTLGSSENKLQLIELLRDLLSICCSRHQ